MNIYAAIILITLLFQFIMNLIADFLNLKTMSAKIPEEFSDLYDEEKYKKSQEYTIEKTKFGFLVQSASLGALLLFWFLGGFNFVDLSVRSLGFSEIFTGLFFMGTLILANGLLGLPFSIYSTFVIEEKYGFNKTTVKTFISDLIKGILLGIIIGTPVLYLVLWFFINMGNLAWLYVWAAVVTIGLVIQFIAPVWIMPLFNKFKPMEDGDLKSAILNYASKVSFSLRDVFVMDGSKRSSKANAFFTGFGKNKRIALFDTLIEKQSTGELVSVLAHEIGHYKKRHIIKGMIMSFFHTGVLFYIMSFFLSKKELFDAFYMENVSVYAGLIFFTMLFSPVEMILSVVMSIISRKHEYEADAFAVETTGGSNQLISSLKKLSVDHLSNLTPHAFYVFLNYSHPPVLMRIDAMKRISQGGISKN
jgi:STE24 endopeptidase